eukprot:4502942-Prymnesium_polylepis.1
MQYYPTCKKAVVLEIVGGPPDITKFVEPALLVQANPCQGCGGICFGPTQQGIVQLCKGLSPEQSKTRDHTRGTMSLIMR